MPSTKSTSLLARLSRSIEVRMLGLALVLGLILSLASEYFLTTNNLLNLLDQSVVIGVVAVGMTFVILTGGIDLSVGSVAGFTGIILGLAMREMPIPVSLTTNVITRLFDSSAELEMLTLTAP